jgi:hypothetical protein
MRILRFIYWGVVFFGVFTTISSVHDAGQLMEKFITLQDFTYFAGAVYDLFIAVLSMLSLLIVTVLYNAPEKEVAKKEETTTVLEVR